MERVIDRCTGQGLRVLTVHDSVIAPYTHGRVVQETMREAAAEAVGRELPVEAEHQGLDRWGMSQSTSKRGVRRDAVKDI